MKRFRLLAASILIAGVSTSFAFTPSTELDTQIDTAWLQLIVLLEDNEMLVNDILELLSDYADHFAETNNAEKLYITEQLHAQIDDYFTESHTEFTLTITNISDRSDLESPFAPALVLVNEQDVTFLNPGEKQHDKGLEQLAEDGDPSTLKTSIQNHPLVGDTVIADTPVGAEEAGPLLPGQSYSATFSALPGHVLNFASMLVESNDLFIAPTHQGINLFDSEGTPIVWDITSAVELRDAGTEVNEIPGAGTHQPLRQSGPNDGPDENGVVQIVNDQFDYPDVNQLVHITLSLAGEGSVSTYDPAEYMTLYVGPAHTACDWVDDCYQVKFSPTDNWTSTDIDIIGFAYDLGKSYKLTVVELLDDTYELIQIEYGHYALDQCSTWSNGCETCDVQDSIIIGCDMACESTQASECIEY